MTPPTRRLALRSRGMGRRSPGLSVRPRAAPGRERGDAVVNRPPGPAGCVRHPSGIAGAVVTPPRRTTGACGYDEVTR